MVAQVPIVQQYRLTERPYILDSTLARIAGHPEGLQAVTGKLQIPPCVVHHVRRLFHNHIHSGTFCQDYAGHVRNFAGLHWGAVGVMLIFRDGQLTRTQARRYSEYLALSAGLGYSKTSYTHQI